MKGLGMLVLLPYFMGIWRNYVVLRAGLTLKDNF